MPYANLMISVSVADDVQLVIRIEPVQSWDLEQQMAAEDIAAMIAPGAHWSEGAVMVIPYTDEVDRRIVELVDLLAGIRCSVPRMIQLQLSLDADESRSLETLLQAALPGVTE
jgi:hypothetical protein